MSFLPANPISAPHGPAARNRAPGYVYTLLCRGRALQGDWRALRGVTISAAAQAVLSDHLLGVTTVVLGDLTPAEWRQICADPVLLEFALNKTKDQLTIGRPPRPDEMAELISQGFAASRSAGLIRLSSLGGYLAKEVLSALLSDNLAMIAARYTYKEINAPEFAGLLERLVEIGEHSLNRSFLKGFTANNADSPSWTEHLLIFFREKFPNERCYHEADGDFNYCRGSFAHAREAYLRARALAPREAKVNEKVRNTDRRLKMESRALGEELQRSVKELWKSCAAADSEAAARLCSLALSQPDTVFGLLEKPEPFLADARVNWAALETLESAAADAELPRLAQRWHRLGDEVVVETLRRLASGHALNAASLGLVRSLLEAERIEQVPSDLLKRLASAAAEPGRRGQALCEEAYHEIFAARHYLAADEYFLIGALDRALAEYFSCLAVNPRDRHARHNIAHIMAQQAQTLFEAGNHAAADRKISEALQHDPNSLPALNMQMEAAISQENFNLAIDTVSTMRGIIEENMRGARPGAAEGETPDSWRKLLAATTNNLGALYCRRYKVRGNPADLVAARKHLETALEFEPGCDPFVYNLVRVRLYQGEVGWAAEWAAAYFAGEKADFSRALDLVRAVWTLLERSPKTDKQTVEPLLRTIVACLKKEAAGDGEKKELMSALADQLRENGFASLGAELDGNKRDQSAI